MKGTARREAGVPHRRKSAGKEAEENRRK